MKSRGMISSLIVMSLLSAAQAQYAGWPHTGSLYILTTPEGANLPATATEENFPLLVRLNRETFDFKQAKAGGADIRFSAEGKPLAYQIEDWDVATGTASIWVRIPLIKGSARQEIKMHWGKPDAVSESNGKAVFNETNGFVSVLHMDDPLKDEVGSVEPNDKGTTTSPGMIGKGRRFDPGTGINCGEKLATLPMGSNPHSTSVWIKPEKSNVTPIAWGNEQAQGKVVMQLASPPHIRMDCYFSGGNVESTGRLLLNQWIHVMHTYKAGEARIYVNGFQEGENKAKGGPLNIRTPARMYLGGWYNHFQFEGDIDEARLSNVTRSADWVKLEYENQKPMQTLVGSIVKRGSDFSASVKQLTVREGQSATVSASAGGAQKVYWVLKADGQETLVGVDRFTYTFNAGRVTGDTARALQFRAVYANEVKVIDIPIAIKEDIPEPLFTLNAPTKWDGREAIEVVPQISNLAAMKAKGAGELSYLWDVSGLATIKKMVAGKLLLTRAQNSGKLVVTATIHNGGKAMMQSAVIQVTEPKKDAWVQRAPGKDEKPVDGQFFARDDKNEGTLYYNGTLSEAADSVFLKLYADNKLLKTEHQTIKQHGAGVTAPSSAVGGQDYTPAYAFTLKLKPGLIKYKVEFGVKTGGQEKIVETVSNLVCGDAFIIDGQSNALATDTHEESPRETNDWIRSFGGPTGRGDATKWVENEYEKKRMNLWCNPVWKFEGGKERQASIDKHKAELGWWGMELAKRLLASQKVPICIITAAVGGTRIDEHQRNEANPADLNTLYGRMLWRVQQSKLTHGIRAILWHQGENDQGSAGPTGGYGWESYQNYFVDMSAGWKQDFPNVQHYTIFQIWPNSCAMGGTMGSGDMLREKQRTLPLLYSNMSIMSTLGIRPPGPAHYPLAGWAEFARLIQPLIERDLYGKIPTVSITPPNLKSASYAKGSSDTILLAFDQPVVWTEALAGQFYLDGEKDKVGSGSLSGNVLTLKLKEASAAKKITYLKETSWSQDTLLNGVNGIAALTFCNVPIEK